MVIQIQIQIQILGNMYVYICRMLYMMCQAWIVSGKNQTYCVVRQIENMKRDYKSFGVIALLELLVPCFHGVTRDHLSFFRSHLSTNLFSVSPLFFVFLSISLSICLGFSSSKHALLLQI